MGDLFYLEQGLQLNKQGLIIFSHSSLKECRTNFGNTSNSKFITFSQQGVDKPLRWGATGPGLGSRSA